MKQNSSLSKSKKWEISPPSSPSTINRHRSETPKSRAARANVVDAETEYMDEVEDDGQDDVSVKERINRARARLRKLDSQNPRSPKTPILDSQNPGSPKTPIRNKQQ
ncbi:hypothetical protein L195_g055015 [Trifolium pratense]|uniref:Uncharacterized protein n=2 Tax=Trifolium pratense TaxID=57577 RepID=A0A2K3KJ38_TRIPR|nr:hypothetical protein L195_g055015 [Trifolium pratense]